MRPLPMKIGADPEFTFNLGNSTLSAQNVIQSIFSKVSNNKMGKEIADYGNIGWDGCSSTAEIRPNPSTQPEEVINNIRGLLGSITKKNTLLSMKTLNLNAPIGGHIHFDTSILDKDKAIDPYKDSKLIQQLHYHITLYSLPIFLGENFKHFTARRQHGGYGKFSDYRNDLKGSAMTYEFRVPSAEWITTPKIALSTLAYLGVVFAEIARDPSAFFNANKDIAFIKEEQAKAIEQLFIADYRSLLRKHILTIKKRIKTFEYYEDYKNEITYLLNPKRILQDKEKCRYDAAIGWGLKQETIKPSKRFFLAPLKKTEESFLKKIGKETIDSPNIGENGDTHTSYFAATLAAATVKSGIKLKHNYYIYGLRSGVKSPIVYTGKGKFLAGHEMIKTIKDAYEISAMISRISANTGSRKENTILIGVPHEERETLNTKPFMNLIWKTEKNILKEAEINPTTLIDDTAESAEIGALAAVYQKELKKE